MSDFNRFLIEMTVYRPLTLIVITILLSLILWIVLASYNRARKAKALDILGQWNNIQTPDTMRYLNLLFTLEQKSVEQIFSGQAISITAAMAKEYLPELVVNSAEQEMYLINVITVLNIRRAMISSLNAIEIIALAYQYNIADRTILIAAYKYLFVANNLLSNCLAFMDKYEEALIGDWPSIKNLEMSLNGRAAPRKKRSKY